MRDVRVDVLAERDLARKVRDAERLLSEDAKEALDLVQPRRARRRVVEVHARILREPLLHLRRRYHGGRREAELTEPLQPGHRTGGCSSWGLAEVRGDGLRISPAAEKVG